MIKDKGQEMMTKKDEFEKMAELNELFQMNLEPALNKKILIQTGPDLQLIAYDQKGKQVRT